jgi:hypothetical protein
MEKVTRMITDNPLQLLDVDADYEPSAADLAWARGLVEDPCAAPLPGPAVRETSIAAAREASTAASGPR